MLHGCKAPSSVCKLRRTSSILGSSLSFTGALFQQVLAAFLGQRIELGLSETCSSCAATSACAAHVLDPLRTHLKYSLPVSRLAVHFLFVQWWSAQTAQDAARACSTWLSIFFTSGEPLCQRSLNRLGFPYASQEYTGEMMNVTE